MQTYDHNDDDDDDDDDDNDWNCVLVVDGVDDDEE